MPAKSIHGRRPIGQRSECALDATGLTVRASVATLVFLGSSWVAIADGGPVGLERQLSTWARTGSWAGSEVWGIVTLLGSLWVLGPVLLVFASWLLRRGQAHLAWLPAVALAATYVLV
ncbi:MAG: hypothetical protein M3Q20_06190, partial [Actinomycetota bacterium]|nr:hypothetical protein [Actinomycetota bacterium]